MATIADFLGGGLPAGLLSPEQMTAAEQRAQNASLLNLGFALLQGSRGQPGQGRPGLAQIIGQAGPVALQAYQQSFDRTLTDALRGMQIAEMRRKQQTAEQLRQLAPSLITTTRGPETREMIASEQGDDYITRPGAVTGYGVNMQALPALAALGPEGMEYASNLAKFQETFKPKTFTLKPGERVVTETGEVKAEVPQNPDRVDLNTHIAFVDPANPTRVLGTIPKGKDPKDLSSTELNVGKSFTAEAAPYIAISQAYTKIEAAATNKSPAGDLSLIFGYMKILDPGSVVREGEFATAQNTGSVPESIRSLYNRIVSGERLTETQRADFLGQAKNLVRSQKQLFDTTLIPKYNSIIESNKLNKQNVMYDPFANIDLAKPKVTMPRPNAAQTPSMNRSDVDLVNKYLPKAK